MYENQDRTHQNMGCNESSAWREAYNYKCPHYERKKDLKLLTLPSRKALPALKQRRAS